MFPQKPFHHQIFTYIACTCFFTIASCSDSKSHRESTMPTQPSISQQKNEKGITPSVSSEQKEDRQKSPEAKSKTISSDKKKDEKKSPQVEVKNEKIPTSSVEKTDGYKEIVEKKKTITKINTTVIEKNQDENSLDKNQKAISLSAEVLFAKHYLPYQLLSGNDFRKGHHESTLTAVRFLQSCGLPYLPNLVRHHEIPCPLISNDHLWSISEAKADTYFLEHKEGSLYFNLVEKNSQGKILKKFQLVIQLQPSEFTLKDIAQPFPSQHILSVQTIKSLSRQLGLPRTSYPVPVGDTEQDFIISNIFLTNDQNKDVFTLSNHIGHLSTFSVSHINHLLDQMIVHPDFDLMRNPLLMNRVLTTLENCIQHSYCPLISYAGSDLQGLRIRLGQIIRKSYQLFQRDCSSMTAISAKNHQTPHMQSMKNWCLPKKIKLDIYQDLLKQTESFRHPINANL